MQDDRTRPLRLHEAATRAFPDGSMTVSGLRKERDRGRLAVFMIAGKEYTTLDAIDEMIRLCLVSPRKAPASGSNPSAPGRTAPSKRRSGASSTMEASSEALDAARRTVEALKNASRNTSPRSASATAPASVVRLR
jgi:hypothetical protein